MLYIYIYMYIMHTCITYNYTSVSLTAYWPFALRVQRAKPC